MRELLYLAVAGALGSVSRYTVSGWAYRAFGSRFPYGTLIVNVVGSLLLGFLMEFAVSSEVVPRGLRVAVTVGFLGAFTTFSTFSYETMRYVEDGALWPAVTNVVVNLVLGLLAVGGGLALGRLALGSVH